MPFLVSLRSWQRPSLGGRASGIIIWGKSSPVCHLPCQVKSTKGLPDCSFFKRFSSSAGVIYLYLLLTLPISARFQHYIDISVLLGHPLLFICLKMSTKQDRKEKHTEPQLWPGPFHVASDPPPPELL